MKAKEMLLQANKLGWSTMYVDIDSKAGASGAAAQASHSARLANIKTIPAVFVGARYLGGSDNLAKFLTAHKSQLHLVS